MLVGFGRTAFARALTSRRWVHVSLDEIAASRHGSVEALEALSEPERDAAWGEAYAAGLASAVKLLVGGARVVLDAGYIDRPRQAAARDAAQFARARVGFVLLREARDPDEPGAVRRAASAENAREQLVWGSRDAWMVAEHQPTRGWACVGGADFDNLLALIRTVLR